jgi:Holliday junction resolvasome RuvABC endonuclease subunit
MTKIRVAGIDPSLRNMGVAHMTYDLITGEMAVTALHLIQTEKTKHKVVRQNSDDLRRAQELVQEFHRLTQNQTFVFAEIPSGGQSASAMKAFGIALGILASCPVPLIQVQPAETKLAAVGTKTASKQEMIEWATETYPKAPWLRLRDKPDGKILNDNEHLADAVAVVHAGVRTDEFKRLAAFMTRAA